VNDVNVNIYNTDKKYNIIYADPPWPYNESGSKAKVKDCHYPMMQLNEICNLPIKNLQAENCILFLWVTAPRLPMAFRVMESWGFEYHSLGFDWLKISKNGKPMWGPGYYTRQNNEFCLVGVPRDKKRRLKPQVHDVLVPVIEQRREHSRKPDSVRDNIVRICGDHPRIELFARQSADGWDCWGNETDKFTNGGW
jgi:site-specific DNA-methyltransferase (adenine-specific)